MRCAPAVAAAIPRYGSPSNPVDLTGSLISQPEILHRALAVAVEHPDTHMIAVLLGCADSCAAQLIDAIEAAYRATDIPLVVVWTGGSGRPRERLRKLGIPCYADPGRAAAALGSLADFSLRPPLPLPQRPRGIDRDAARAVLRQAKASWRDQLNEHDATRLIAAYGVRCAPSLPVDTPDAAAVAAAGIDAPVAVKLLADTVGHKSDIGGVRLGLTGPSEVRAEAESLLALADEHGVADAKVLVQRMARGDVELIVGIKQDPAFGPVVVVGLGGVFVDVLADSQAAAAPVDHDAALRMLRSLRGSRLFGQVRGRPACDLDSAADAIVRLSWLAEDEAADLAELDVNPLLLDARAGTATAVDCLAVLR